MIKSWDEDFKELNLITLTDNQKAKMLKNIKANTNRRRTFQGLKYLFFVTAAIALSFILTTTMISNKHIGKSPSTSASPPKKHVTAPSQASIDPGLQLSKNDSNGWEVVSRLRCDLGVIESIEKGQKQIKLTIKRTNSFGGDADPLGQIIKPDTDKRTYILMTTEKMQILHLNVNQEVLLLMGQYQQKSSSDTFWAAEVIGAAKKDGKLYMPDGKPLNLMISSNVKITDGILKIQQ